MSNENKSFTVKDRRLFTPEGELRGDEEKVEAEVPCEAPQRPSSPARPAPRREAGQEERVELAEFLMSLGSQALEALMARPPQLQPARALIGVLEMLGDKTEGRRTPEESEVLESLLYQLRLAYVEQTKGGRV